MTDHPTGNHLPTNTNWETAAQHLPHTLTNIRWWFGDLLNQAPTHQHHTNLLNNTPALEPGETALCQRVAELFPPNRRRPNLSWHHHQAVTDLPEHTADQILDIAETDRLPIQKVREHAARAKQPLEQPAPTGGFDWIFQVQP